MWPEMAHSRVDDPAELVWQAMLQLDGSGPWNLFTVWSAGPPTCPCGSATIARCTAGSREVTGRPG